ncbi:MAG: D-tyrosyl-tRNA(Tyr) deacylase [Candidatus Eremiobacteraeota bacterium]|nr:D-tyrosyl-tRNA(Tyr) deacylase [Candidatus Eremiobacteraeota bacterium]MBV8282191.1 D-tyrosyl-tRNA(Tyr) deacylase [Candidatus Eremiobacteraeota bacterium]
MRAVIQRVSSASVEVDGAVSGAIERGFLALIGVARDDAEGDAIAMATKIAGLRVFNDDAGDMNRSLKDVGGGILAVSQFTLYGDARKGRRPSFIDAAPGETAAPLFDQVVTLLRREGLTVQTGVFGAQMHVSLVNEGPVTILLDSRKLF